MSSETVTWIVSLAIMWWAIGIVFYLDDYRGQNLTWFGTLLLLPGVATVAVLEMVNNSLAWMVQTSPPIVKPEEDEA